MTDDVKKSKAVRSGFDSTTFEADVSIYVERKVGSATISPSGRDVALASTDGLDIIDLDSPLNPPRHLRHGLPWLVADVQWSPFAARDYWVASTANQKALVWNLNMHEDSAQGVIEHTLSGHTRAITDMNFSAHHPDILATCAVDGYVHCWDLRRPRQPSLTFCDWFAGATQVKYNRQDSHILASSHDRWLRIWDDRKGAEPLKSINAHESKIYGLDWNRTRCTGVVTCSLDKSIKFWDYGNEVDEPERIIRTDFPVWRARHTPFGWGLLAMPQNSPGQLHLYDRRSKEDTMENGKTQTVRTFPGHGNSKVKEFLWRSRGGITDDGVDNREFQLVSWGDDNQLRLQHVDPTTLADVGYVKGSQVRKRLNVTRKGAVYKTFRSVENATTENKIPSISGPRPGGFGLRMSALSVGMKKMTVPNSTRGPMTIGAPAMKARERSKKSEDQEQKQIGWMSGIKFNKQDTAHPYRKPGSSRGLSLLNSEFKEDGDWDGPESLHDEIIRIHEQLPKITFEDVNMDKRTVVASMNGPWGENGNTIYIKVTVTFPAQYPETKAPVFNLGKTSLMPEDTYSKLKKEVHQLASGFVTRKQGCLEAALCYLLGEVDLETSTTFIDETGDEDDDLDGLADESSSDDEDTDMIAGTSAMMSQELEGSASEDMLNAMSRNANVPLPKECGARFSTTGKLVCFFPPKEDKVKSLLGTLVAKNSSRSKGDPVFENFGRLNNNSSPANMSLASENHEDSEMSEDSDVSSSSDSDSSPFRIPRFPMSGYFRRSNRRSLMNGSSVLSHKSSAGGTGTNTGTGTGTGLSKRHAKPKNVVSIHDISDILPAKAVLAQEYAIFGDGPDVCEHNAKAAQKHGFEDLADVWRYAALLLHNEIPLEILEQSHRREPVLVVAKESLRQHRRNSGSDSGVDISFDTKRRPSYSGRVKWGKSPLANQLIADLFTHFERLADIQMLAMLSCVFSEPGVKDAASKTESYLTQPQTPLTMKTPAFSLDYFPSNVAAWSMYQTAPVSSISSTPKMVQTPSGLYGSLGSSSGGAWGSDPASASYSLGDTPESLIQQSQSLSTSPDNHRTFRRANSGIASSFAANLSRPFSTISSSPPIAPPSRKRPSPVENMIASLTPSAISWGNTTVLGSVKESAASGRVSYSDDELAADYQRNPACTGIRVKITNASAFDDEGCMSLPLLHSSYPDFYVGYRKSYANLLYAWRHPLARLEILKFNALKDPFREDVGKSFEASIPRLNPDSTPSAVIVGQKDIALTIPAGLDPGLDTAGYCLKHEVILDALKSGKQGGAVGRCERCKSIQSKLSCAFCQDSVDGLYTSCLSCGCVTHQDCLLDYQLAGYINCPGGCDCDCSARASMGHVEGWEIMLNALGKRLEHSDEVLTDFEDKDYLEFPVGGLGKGHSTLGGQADDFASSG